MSAQPSSPGLRNLRAVARSAFLLTALLYASSAGAGSSQIDPSEQSIHFDGKARASKKDILSTLQEDGHFETLVKAINAAGLDQMLRTHGPLTMFAPTDQAFAKLSASKLDRLLKEPQELKQVLRYHVLRAYVPAKQLARLKNALTASGAVVRIDGTSGIKVNSALVTHPDILAANGVVHAVDAVLFVPERATKGKDHKKDAADSETSEPKVTADPKEHKPES